LLNDAQFNQKKNYREIGIIPEYIMKEHVKDSITPGEHEDEGPNQKHDDDIEHKDFT
jgi:hypothetical protein